MSRSRGSLHSGQRGVTLVEVVVVGVLATIVMLAITGFYINSQGTWIEASSQAVTQREATVVLQAISEKAHQAYGADVTGARTILFFVPGPAPGGMELCRFWVADDSLMHWGDPGAPDRGPLATSKVTRFDLAGSPDSTMVKVLALEMRSANGRLVRLSTNAAFLNRPPLP